MHAKYRTFTYTFIGTWNSNSQEVGQAWSTQDKACNVPCGGLKLGQESVLCPTVWNLAVVETFDNLDPSGQHLQHV